MIFYDFIYKIDNFCRYNNPWNIRKEAQTSDKYGFFADKRPIEELVKNSIINLDKPPGPTSHEVAFWIKKMFNLNKVGHGGTLEP
ncbi:tRNA pseudouridine synthase A [Acidianus infernus]|uniref:tRNA pseudouridine synthase A n=1 Tax=Acidianus infernus TaxID=12915 RepID=A0A6A9QEE5_ACIIN|nr:tRNA pseudouridine synthase A [Acidianus infernus]MCY0873362.1 tRNA pseudouridine synthase A [Acidianus infernus]MCY0882627.1 tRNA pseudouridine synthase A [Acidianus infernus]MUM64544.1 tRNA pseudouridine synthase A [Acidianus infernus]